MAVFIKKERLGSGPAPVKRRAFSGGTKFGVMAEAFEKAKAQREKTLDEKYESNAEVQRWRTLSQEEKMRDAIDRMTPTGKAIEEMRQGREVSDEEGRKYAEKLAYKSERQKDGE